MAGCSFPIESLMLFFYSLMNWIKHRNLDSKSTTTVVSLKISYSNNVSWVNFGARCEPLCSARELIDFKFWPSQWRGVFIYNSDFAVVHEHTPKGISRDVSSWLATVITNKGTTEALYCFLLNKLFQRCYFVDFYSIQSDQIWIQLIESYTDFVLKIVNIWQFNW